MRGFRRGLYEFFVEFLIWRILVFKGFELVDNSGIGGRCCVLGRRWTCVARTELSCERRIEG